MKALLFDMDGTLTDSMTMWFHLTIDYLHLMGVDPQNVDATELAPLKLVDALELLIRKHGSRVGLSTLEKYIRERLDTFYAQEVQLKPGILETLQAFQRMGIPIAVGSATDEEFVELSLRHTEIRDMFEFVMTVDNANLSKNDPAFYTTAAARFGIDASEMTLFDDATLPCLAAQRAGAYAVGVIDHTYPQDLAQLREHSDELLDGFAHFDPLHWWHRQSRV